MYLDIIFNIRSKFYDKHCSNHEECLSFCRMGEYNMKTKLNIIEYLFIFIFMIYAFSGCANSTEANQLISDEHLHNKSYYFEPKINDDNHTYVYNGNTIHSSYLIHGGEENTEIGLFLLINGIPHKFHISNISTEDKFMNVIDIEKDGHMEIEVSLDPTIGTKGDILNVDIFSIKSPSYDLASEAVEERSDHILYQGTGFKIEIEEDTINTICNGLDNYTLNPITKEERANYNTDDGSNMLDNFSFFALQQDMETSQIISTDGMANAVFRSFGAESNNCKTTLFINHEPVRIMDSDYLEYEVNENNEVLFDLEIDTKNSEENSVIYCITSYIRRDDPEQRTLITKTKSALLMNEQ